MAHLICFGISLQPAETCYKIVIVQNILTTLGSVHDHFSYRSSRFWDIPANYFSHLSQQPEKLKLLMGDLLAAVSCSKKSWEMGNEPFYKRPLNWHHCVHSKYSFTKWNVYLLASWELISNSSQNIAVRPDACSKKNQGSLFKRLGTACLSFHVFGPDLHKLKQLLF